MALALMQDAWNIWWCSDTPFWKWIEAPNLCWPSVFAEETTYKWQKVQKHAHNRHNHPSFCFECWTLYFQPVIVKEHTHPTNPAFILDNVYNHMTFWLALAIPKCQPISPRRQQDQVEQTMATSQGQSGYKLSGRIFATSPVFDGPWGNRRHAAIPGLFVAGLSHLEDPVHSLGGFKHGKWGGIFTCQIRVDKKLDPNSTCKEKIKEWHGMTQIHHLARYGEAVVMPIFFKRNRPWSNGLSGGWRCQFTTKRAKHLESPSRSSDGKEPPKSELPVL